MTFEESAERFNRIFEKSDRFEKIFNMFSKDYLKSLKEVIQQHRPLIKQNLDNFNKQISLSIEKSMRWALETLFFCMTNDVGDNNVTVPQRTDKDNEQEKLSLQLKNIPDDDKELYSQIFWDGYNEIEKRENYNFAVFNMIKELLVKHYYNEIIELNGDSLRRLSGDLYYLAAENLIEDIYLIERKIKPRKPIF